MQNRCIERLGTGTGDIIRLCKQKNLNEPEFIQEEEFKTVIWRTIKSGGEVNEDHEDQIEDNEKVNNDHTLQDTLQDTLQVEEEVIETIKRVVLVLRDEMKRAEIQEMLGLRDRVNFVSNYLDPALESTYIELTIPESPTSRDQRYRLTTKGIALKKKLMKYRKKK